MMESNRIPPNALFKSFLIVAGGYLFSMVTLILLTMLIGYNFFPDSAAFWATPDMEVEAFYADPELLMPDDLFWIVLIAHGLASVGIGWMIARISPFAKFNHAIFVSVVIFVGFIQSAIGAPSELQWKFILMMAVFPIAILYGASMTAKR